jgi:2'-5' RNA ligase
VSAERRSEKPVKPATARVFFALWPPAELAEQLADIAREAAGRFGGRATRRETIHLTLAFLGEVPESRLDELGAAAAEVRGQPFEFSLDRLGCWRHNHLLWAGCSQPAAALEKLQADLGQALIRAGFKVDGPGRTFSPHLTLVRKLPPGVGPVEVAALPAGRARSWHCERFVLVRSKISSSGSEYLILREFFLDKMIVA